MKGTVQHDGSSSDPFPIKSGIKQRCILAPTLFGILFSLLLCYTFSESKEGIYLHTRSNGSLFNLFILGQDISATPCISIGDCTLDVVEDFTYLGSNISSNLGLDTKLNVRIGKASAAMARLIKRVWENTMLTIKTKTQVYQACVLSTLLYGCLLYTSPSPRDA